MKEDEKVTVRGSKIVEGLALISKEAYIGKLTEEERAEFEKAQFAEEQAKKSQYVFGGRIY